MKMDKWGFITLFIYPIFYYLLLIVIIIIALKMILLARVGMGRVKARDGEEGEERR